jgi:uncharacterized repeat protein (TIGR01451 family)
MLVLITCSCTALAPREQFRNATAEVPARTAERLAGSAPGADSAPGLVSQASHSQAGPGYQDVRPGTPYSVPGPPHSVSGIGVTTHHGHRTTATTHDSTLGTDAHPATTICPHDGRVPLACPPAAICPPTAACPPQFGFGGPQMPFAGPYPFPPNAPGHASAGTPPLPIIPGQAADMVDEFLCDGGDRALPVHYDRFHRHGLDTQDTVAEYVDEHGEWHVRPSNIVCLYAPRFGQVRTLSGATEDMQVLGLAAAVDRNRGIALGQQTGTVSYAQPAAIGSIRVRSRASGLEQEHLAAGIHQPLAPLGFDRPLPALENVTFFLTGLMSETEEPFLARSVQAALEWTRDEFPVVMASTAAGQELHVAFTGAEIIGIDDQKLPGELRIVKAADRATALPGDVVTFTLRYDNLGDRELFHVRIVDNLTPRLAYVADSATSDRPGDITVTDNGEGSSLLTFELDEPLPGRTGGTITFQARVR